MPPQLVIVDDLDVLRPLGSPDEADSPLIIHANAMLPDAIAFQSFELIPRWNFEVFQSSCQFQLRNLSQRDAFDIYPSTHSLATKEGLCVLALEGLDRHNTNSNARRY